MPRVSRSVADAASNARRELASRARPPGAFDASRYFRTTERLAFLNVGTAVVRALARSVAREHREVWALADAVAFADILMRDPHLEVKGLAIEVLACYKREFVPGLLATVLAPWSLGRLRHR